MFRKKSLDFSFMEAIIQKSFERIICQALEEDIGEGDITTLATIPEALAARGSIISKEEGIVAGVEFAGLFFSVVDRDVEFEARLKDGARVQKGDHIAEIKGSARTLLSCERVLLNFMQRMSGIATTTRSFVDAVKATGAIILDTRKTAPGLRGLDKWAVRIGGGQNHRHGLYDMVLIKENHITALGSIREAVRRVRTSNSAGRKIEVEAKTLDEVREALELGVDRILLDNMKPDTIRAAVQLAAGNIALEASGNITLQNVREIAETGVDFVSVGVLTHSARALDLSLLIRSTAAEMRKGNV
jgi:nicotinate-nucleotide pyrophosphorylase (carboxylating)